MAGLGIQAVRGTAHELTQRGRSGHSILNKPQQCPIDIDQSAYSHTVQFVRGMEPRRTSIALNDHSGLAIPKEFIEVIQPQTATKPAFQRLELWV